MTAPRRWVTRVIDRRYLRIVRTRLEDCRHIGDAKIAEDLREDVPNEVHDERAEDRAA